LSYSTSVSTSLIVYGAVDIYADILTIKEVAKYLKVTERTLYRLAQEGKIPAFKVGGSWRFKHLDIDAWIEGQKTGTARGDDPGEAH